MGTVGGKNPFRFKRTVQSFEQTVDGNGEFYELLVEGSEVFPRLDAFGQLCAQGF
ncbi:hypothetical protein J7J47_19160 [Halomonas sp. ISL-60]|uniref:hypothetical protein n=1 Tax=Halomonas sp. ISL-56 TaxID=2819149 RepID=UPI001BED1B3C|nr:hypothetical protein [Halomonas sp. ISL-56]MBT2774349.1 hypothetical protein [Halomonas sp. ISL-60]MBT2799918.1 hypothetical protein [Halomonas sp. ISL-56]